MESYMGELVPAHEGAELRLLDTPVGFAYERYPDLQGNIELHFL